MQTGTTASIAATTTNDPAALPVVWSCAPSGSCGSFSVTPTASGAATVYTAPATVPTGGSVTITATSASDSTKTANATVMITKAASASMLNGHYCFFIQAPTGSRGTATFVGSVQLDGAGNVLGGVEDVVSPVRFDVADPVLATSAGSGIPNASYYTVDPSGHGTLRMKTQNQETLDLSFVLTSSSHGQIIEVAGDPGSGTLDLQQTTTGGFAASQISGPYSLTMDGIDSAANTTKVSFGGIFTGDGIGSVSNVALQVSKSGTAATALPVGTGNFTVPDANGRGILTIFGGGWSYQWTYYVVTGKVLRLFENDNVDLMGGSAYAQGTASTTLSGNYAYRHSGWSATGRTVAAGQLAATTAGTITGGTSDANAGAAPPTTHTSAAVSGNYTLSLTAPGTMSLTDAAGTSTFGVYLVDPMLNVLDPNNPSGGGGALLQHTDASIIGTGLLLPQSPAATFTGNYALDLMNSIATTTPNELDLVGVLTSNSTANFTNGLADYDQNNPTNPVTMFGGVLTGTFTKDATNAGRFTGTITVTPPAVAGSYPFIPGAATPTTFSVSIYQATVSQAFVVETDTQANSEGVLVQQAIQ